MFWEPARLRRIAWAVAAAIMLALILGYVSDVKRESLVKRGDFPGFYVLALILKRHSPALLYDPELQRAIENEIWPAFEGTFYMSVYPPYVALLLRPLAEFEAQMAQMIFTFFNLLALCGAFYIAALLNPTLIGKRMPLLVLSLCFAPIFYGVFGAQNTALSMLLYSILIYGVARRDAVGDMAAGLAAGAWLFKPQYGLLAIAFSLVLRRPLIAAAAAIPASLYYLLGAWQLGYQWPLLWWNATSKFAAQNLISNSDLMVSFVSTIKIYLLRGGLSSSSNAYFYGSMLANTAAGALVALLCIKCWRDREFRLRFALLLGPALTLFSPQTLFYDLGICWMPLICCFDFNKDRSYRMLFLLVAITLPITFFRESLPFPLFVLFPIIIAWLSLKERPIESSKIMPGLAVSGTTS